MADKMYCIWGSTLTCIGDAIRAKTGTSDKIDPNDMPAAIEGIEGSGGAEGCATVTFVASDAVLLSRPVYIGDDCPDPVAQGRIAAPTKDSTIDTVYTFNGWSESLEGITEDKTVEAVYKESAREYTVRFYDGDTLLHTEQVPYGVMPDHYETTKDGYTFEAWEPALAPVTGDISYHATWGEMLKFSGSSWSDISAACEAGEASRHFAVGDTRTITAGDHSYVLRVIAIDTDTKADGSGKAGLTIMVDSPATDAVLSPAAYWGHTTGNSLRDWLSTTFSARLSSDLLAVVKPVTKVTAYQNGSAKWGDVTTTDSFFVPSTYELYDHTYEREVGGVRYSYLSTAGTSYSKAERVFKTNDGTAMAWWLRNYRANVSCSDWVQENGSLGTGTAGSNKTYYVRPCFCI